MKVIFFDTDSDLKSFAKQHPIKNTTFVFEKNSLNQTSHKNLQSYSDAAVISVFTHSEILDPKKLDLFPNLKLIATRSTGINHIDQQYCHKRRIQIVNVPYYGAQTVAEFAFGLLLNISRHIINAQQDMARNRIHTSEYTGFDLYGKTIGIIGTGSIGRHMIRLANGFGMKVLAYDLYPTKELQDYYVSFESLLKQRDIISLHIPSTPENYHLLNQQAFKKMKKGVYIINTARGDLIDTQALYQAVKSGVVAAAGLDVLENEDILLHDDLLLHKHNNETQILLDSAMNLKLLQHPHVIATPHIAFNTTDALQRILQTTFQNIRNFCLKEHV